MLDDCSEIGPSEPLLPIVKMRSPIGACWNKKARDLSYRQIRELTAVSRSSSVESKSQSGRKKDVLVNDSLNHDLKVE